MSDLFICPACGGDGKETCNNPDHGFIEAIGSAGKERSPQAHDIGRLGCPCCGHHPYHKIRTWHDGAYHQNDCDVCNGMGKATEVDAEKYLKDSRQEDFELIHIEQ